MSTVVVQPVKSWWQRRQFMNLPWDIYRGDPLWIPPLRGNHKELLNYKHSPFYDDAEIQTFLALRDGKPVGRIGAIVNHAHNRRFKEQRGFFGFFECEDNQQTADALFNTAKDWLVERGMTAIRGPASPSMNHECGLLVDGFDTSPTFMNTYNPPYYEKLVKQYGFTKAHDMYAFTGRVDDMIPVVKKIEPLVKKCQQRFDIKLRPFSVKKFNAEVRLFLEIFNKSFEDVWGFVPISSAETDHMAQGLRPLIAPELTSIAEVNGQAVAAVFALLDYNPRIKAIGGRLFPFGFMHLLMNRKAIKKIRVISANVTPEFQRWGVGPLVVSQLLPILRDWGVEEVEFSWVLESNTLSFGTLQRTGAAITKTYRMYDLDLA